MKQAPVLNEREKQRMLQHLQRTSYGARNRCMLQLSWLAGMRVGEIAALDVGDVVGADGEIRAEIQLRADQTKGDQARTVLVNSQLRDELRRYLEQLKIIADPPANSRRGADQLAGAGELELQLTPCRNSA